MSSKSPTEAVYKERKRKKKTEEEKIESRKAYQKKRDKALKDMAWWIPR